MLLQTWRKVYLFIHKCISKMLPNLKTYTRGGVKNLTLKGVPIFFPYKMNSSNVNF